MKKRIVFAIPSLAAGGGEKSLVNLLNCIDFKLYEVDLILLNRTGVFLKSLPKEVTIIDLEGDYVDFTKGLFNSIFHFLFKFKIYLILNRIIYSFKNAFLNNKAKAEQYSWNNLSTSIAVLDNEYDVAVSFLEKTSMYFIIDKIKANKKIGWIHTNYSSSGMDPNFDNFYFRRMNAIITVSEECNQDLKVNFPDLKDKISTIYNLISPSLILSMAESKISENVFIDTPRLIVTIARLSYEKGCDLAVMAAEKLLRKNIDFKWLIIGEGGEYSNLKKIIKNNKLEQNMFLIGLRENPYPYLKAAMLYVQPSRYEGKSIAIDEAKILGKPIVVTNFSTAKDQIISNINGIIVDRNADALATTIANVLEDKKLQNALVENLSKEKLGTESEINKFYELVNE